MLDAIEGHSHLWQAKHEESFVQGSLVYMVGIDKILYT